MKITFTVSINTPDPRNNNVQDDPELIEQLEALQCVFDEEVKKNGFTFIESFWEEDT
jgi:hypothetical protein